MASSCDLCGVVRAVVYCKSDSARLCLGCDVRVHAANVLSCRHSRYLLCDKCNILPAIVHYVDDKLSLCQECDWNQNNGSSQLEHRRRARALNYYTGCPSFTEFSRFVSFVLESSSSVDSNPEWASLNTLPKSENSISKCMEQPNDDGSFDLVSDKLNDIEPCVDFEPWLEQSSIIPPNPNTQNFPKEPLNVNDLVIHDGNGLNMENIQFNFENIAEIFDCSQIATRYHIDNGGVDYDQLMENNILVTKSNALIENAIEESTPSIKQDCVAFQSSWADSSTSVLQGVNNNANCALTHPSFNDEKINLGFPQGQINSSVSLPLPNIIGESSAPNYQDYGLPPIFLTEESSWEPNLESTCPQAREKAKIRYNEKKKTRRFGKQIRYVSRKVRADTRKRVKGRFVKASEACDCDPQEIKNF